MAGALTLALVRLNSIQASLDNSAAFVGVELQTDRDPVRLSYWVVASIVAYLLTIWIARRQGYHRGIWVDRYPLVMAGLVALLVAVAVVFDRYIASALPNRGNVPLLAIAVGIVVWALRERRLGLWILAAVIVPLTILANGYNMENVLLRFGVPYFNNADEVANLGTVAVVLFAASAIFGVLHRREARAVRTRGAR